MRGVTVNQVVDGQGLRSDYCHSVNYIYSDSVTVKVIEALRGRFVGRPNGVWQRLRCPYISNHKHGDRHPSASLNLETGWIFCYVCGRHSPEETAALLKGQSCPVGRNYRWSNPSREGERRIVNLTDAYRRLQEATACTYLQQRGITGAAIAAYDVRIGDGVFAPCGSVCFPYIDLSGNVIGVKYRYTHDNVQQRYGAVRGSSFSVPFGIHALMARPYLVVAEGEINALSLWIACNHMADVVSIGSQTPSNQLLRTLHALASRYAMVVLWTDEPQVTNALQRLHPLTVQITSQRMGSAKGDANDVLMLKGTDALLQTVRYALSAYDPRLREAYDAYEEPYA